MSALQEQLQILRKKFDEMPERDQRALKILTAALVPTLLYFMAVYPLQQARNKLREDISRDEKQLTYVQQSAQTINSLRGSGIGEDRKGRSLAQVATDSAQERGLTVSRMQPKNEHELQLWLDDVPYDAVLNYLYDMDTRFGVQINVAQILSGASVGTVRVTLKLKDGNA